MKKVLVIVAIILASFFLLRENISGPKVSQNGISTYQLADDLMSKYDRNADQKLSVNEESFLKTKSDNLIKIESRGLLFTDADAFGNADGYVSKTELKQYLDQFDTDNNGDLTSYINIFNSIFGGKSEWTKFDKKYGERYKYEEI
ncbi:MAG: hypothetical protein R2753_10740 [Chitinophagales bacterium]